MPPPETAAASPTGRTRTGGDDALVVEGIEKSFGDVHAIRGVSFTVPRGSVLGLLGPNGAGKTTTVNVLSTLIRPDRGRALVAGHDVTSDPAAVRRSIMMTGQYAALDESLTGRENLVLFGRLMGLSKRDARTRAADLLTGFDLEEAADRKVAGYSGGMRRRVDIACGLVTRPEVIFLDEPTTGLDPRSRQGVWSLVTALREQGITILLTTQYLEEADLLADDIVVIDKGTVIARGTADELKERTGGSWCHVVPADPAALPAVRAALTDLLGGRSDRVRVDSDGVAIPAPGGASTLTEVVRMLDARRIPLADVALRRPSLDDVFLSLTGVPDAEPAGETRRVDPQEPAGPPAPTTEPPGDPAASHPTPRPDRAEHRDAPTGPHS
ncbi:DrrA-related ABC transporter ATP-binding protein [Rhodococcus rhodnii]|uniref:ABC-2 type transporter ATPase subunit n=2 Tax=Rhodococcus rhodnii TaxID=38312 RepID=R7WHS9_9NOCA|nr:ATP-binding cassette domain-containing protein [Rhodococcus rhodnii]EOM74693.1 ABC-2 type transporter ATPase subunit [Rhodococcus rhodnii LMG 5362]TXG90395.1 DrrA-related ABC transporter ATP-binding protein [Rhodococcus rhodnii]